MKRGFSDYLVLGLKGMAMGAADIIPGVSGGTIAFISGIYQELILSIKSVNLNFLKILFREGIAAGWRHINGNFLLLVFGGILLSIFSLARVFSWLLAHHQMLVWSFFLGLIVGSAIFVGKKITRWNAFTFIMLIGGTLIAYIITIATPSNSPEALWFVFLTGCIAICAMILPGISGSFLLLLMGKYEFILNAIKEVNILVLASFAAGCAAGLVSFSHLIGWLFRHYPNATMALLSGFMIGSLNKLWPWKEVLEYRTNSMGELIPFLEKSISPATYSALYGKETMMLPIILCSMAGLVLVVIFEKLTQTDTEASGMQQKNS